MLLLDNIAYSSWIKGVHEFSSGWVAYLYGTQVVPKGHCCIGYVRNSWPRLLNAYQPTTLSLGVALTTMSSCCLRASVSRSSFPCTSPKGTPKELSTVTTPDCKGRITGISKISKICTVMHLMLYSSRK